MCAWDIRAAKEHGVRAPTLIPQPAVSLQHLVILPFHHLPRHRLAPLSPPLSQRLTMTRAFSSWVNQESTHKDSMGSLRWSMAGLAGLAGRVASGDAKRLTRCVGPAQWLSRRATPCWRALWHSHARALWHTAARHDSHGHSHGHNHGEHDGPEVRIRARLFIFGRGMPGDAVYADAAHAGRSRSPSSRRRTASPRP